MFCLPHFWSKIHSVKLWLGHTARISAWSDQNCGFFLLSCIYKTSFLTKILTFCPKLFRIPRILKRLHCLVNHRLNNVADKIPPDIDNKHRINTSLCKSYPFSLFHFAWFSEILISTIVCFSYKPLCDHFLVF